MFSTYDERPLVLIRQVGISDNRHDRMGTIGYGNGRDPNTTEEMDNETLYQVVPGEQEHG